MNNASTETVTTYTHAGTAYEIDFLGISHPGQRGECVVYCDGRRPSRRGAAISTWPCPSRPSTPLESFPVAWLLVVVSSDAARGPAHLTKKDESCP